jgi:SAM-dependent methyltransferase
VPKGTGTPTADKRAELGHASQVWTRGLERRLQLLRSYVELEGKRILDVGCGVGAFVRRLRDFSDAVCGVDIDAEGVREGGRALPDLALAVGERLPFRDGVFDVVLLHEVLEHVDDDVATLREARRVLAPNGRVVVFCPNRLYPFETHGVFVGKRYIFGNMPLVNYLPDPLRERLVPHARAYTKAALRRVYRRAGLRPLVHTYVFPGFDHIGARRRWAGRALRYILYPLERSPLRIFGLSHFVVLSRDDEPAPRRRAPDKRRDDGKEAHGPPGPAPQA